MLEVTKHCKYLILADCQAAALKGRLKPFRLDSCVKTLGFIIIILKKVISSFFTGTLYPFDADTCASVQ